MTKKKSKDLLECVSNNNFPENDDFPLACGSVSSRRKWMDNSIQKKEWAEERNQMGMGNWKLSCVKS